MPTLSNVRAALAPGIATSDQIRAAALSLHQLADLMRLPMPPAPRAEYIHEPEAPCRN